MQGATFGILDCATNIAANYTGAATFWLIYYVAQNMWVTLFPAFVGSSLFGEYSHVHCC
jgi:hypothetical protein